VTTATAKAIEQIKRSVKILRRMADDTADWQDAEALHREADVLAAQLEAIELDAQPENAEGELLAAGIEISRRREKRKGTNDAQLEQ